MSCSYIHTLTDDTVTSGATSSQLGDTHPRDHNFTAKEIDIHFFNKKFIYIYIYIYIFFIYFIKLEKYEDLREQCVWNGWITDVFPIEVEYRGFIANSTSAFLTNLGLPRSDKRKYMEKIQDKALTASAWIWQSYWVTTIYESLVVSWDTGGALWASGNDASAPKPCLNPESSSDEGFVGSNAVVQTSVIVWYIYIYIYNL